MLKKNLIANLSITKVFLKTKIKTYDYEVTDSNNKQFLKVDSNHTCLAVMSLDSAFNKDGNYHYLSDFSYFDEK